MTSSHNEQLQSLPHSVESEEQVLGFLLKAPDLMQEYASDLSDASYFYYPRHRKLYKAMLDSLILGEPPDIAILTKRVDIPMSFMIELIEKTTSSKPQSKVHVKRIIDFQCRRDLIFQARQIMEYATNLDVPFGTVSAKAQQAIMSVAVDKSMNKFQHASDLAPALLQEIDDRQTGKAFKRMVKSGIVGLDNITHGLRDGELIVLAGRTSHGKTQLAAQMAVNVAKDGKTVGFVSLEMSELSIIERMILAEAGVSSEDTWKKDFSSDKFDRITKQVNKFVGLPLYIDGSGGCSVPAIASRARQLRAENGLGLLVVDYLQIVRSETAGNREAEVASIAHGLKALAMELKIPVIALSQFSRNVDNRKEDGGRPRLADLRESGAIEQDAGVIIFCYHPKVSGASSELIVAKNRHGKIGHCDMTFVDGTWQTLAKRKEK